MPNGMSQDRQLGKGTVACAVPPPAKRRKLRKGTRSCVACRQRKLKCIWVDPQNSKCDRCAQYSTECVSQIEASNNYISPPHSIRDELLTPEFAPSADIINRGDRSAGNNANVGQTSRPWLALQAGSREIRLTLLRALPSESDIRILLRHIKTDTVALYQSGAKRKIYYPCLPKQQIALNSLLQPEMHPTLLARQMLLLAASLQHVSKREQIPGLSEPHYVVAERIAEAAIRNVTTNDDFLGTLEAVENLVLECFYHVDSGNIRRAWVTLRRAATVGLLLGLNRPGHHRFERIDPRNDLEPMTMWMAIVGMERVQSLLLGLPSSLMSVEYAYPDMSDQYHVSASLQAPMRMILQRNELGDPAEAKRLTKEIDKQILAIAEKAPPSFWQPVALAGLSPDSQEAFHETNKMFDFLCYQITVQQLHVPSIICPDSGAWSSYSRSACYNACREILERVIALRTFNPVSASCRMADFIALIAGLTLMLGIILSHACPADEVPHALAHRRASDRALAQRALACAEAICETEADMLAHKCAVLLRDFLSIEDIIRKACACQNPQSNTAHQTNAQDSGLGELVLRVPHVGAFKVGRLGTITTLNEGSPQITALRDGVSLGGIGSISISRVASGVDGPPANGLTAVPATESATSPTLWPSPENGMTNVASDSWTTEGLSGSFLGAEDSLFQGIDTAFFDAMLKESDRVNGAAPGTISSI